MQAMKLSFELILSSPYVRARQTAEIVARILDTEKRLKFSAHLASDGDAEDLISELKRQRPAIGSVLLVGHEPYLSQLISVLLTGGSDLRLTLKKGGLCKLMVQRWTYGRCAILEWLITPRQMTQMR
jgi:phosphohistidine phosphatase